MQRTVFGRENRSNQFDKLIIPVELCERPGPGTYGHYTQFNNSVKHASTVRAKNQLIKKAAQPA